MSLLKMLNDCTEKDECLCCASASRRLTTPLDAGWTYPADAAWKHW